MRSVLDQRNWAGSRKEVIQYFPQAYSLGNISLNTFSPVVTGTGTNWPYNDVVDTTLVDQVTSIGQQWVTLASMSGVTRNSIFYVDATGTTPEVLPVIDMLGNRVQLKFMCQHAAGASIWQGSLNGQQMRVNGYTTPVYDVLAVTSPTSLTLGQQWAQTPQTGAGYFILLMYISIDPNCKDIVYCTDPFQNLDLDLHVSQQRLNRIDPNRLAVNSPVKLADKGPNFNHLSTWEPWPPTYIPYQLNMLIDLYWPDMRIPSDTPPYFLSPNCIIFAALAQGFATYLGRNGKPDPGQSPQNAALYSGMAEKAFLDAVSADESRVQSMFTSKPISDNVLGVNYDLNHAVGSDGDWLVP